MRDYKKHENNVKEIFQSFITEGNRYNGDFIRRKLNEAFNTSNDTFYDSEVVSKVKVGDIFVLKSSFKSRPFVVCKIEKDLCKVVSLTTSDSHMNSGIEAHSRFFSNPNKSYYSYELNLVPSSIVQKYFIGTMDNITEVRKAYKEVLKYYSKNIKL